MRKITVAITVDERMGIAFNKRRQSRDRVLIKDLLDTATGKVYVSEYSALLFDEHKDRVIVAEDPLAHCPDGGCCFVEMVELAPYIEEIDTLIVYNWNRHYPADKTLDIDLENGRFSLASSTEFLGSSHEKITKETYQNTK